MLDVRGSAVDPGGQHLPAAFEAGPLPAVRIVDEVAPRAAPSDACFAVG